MQIPCWVITCLAGLCLWGGSLATAHAQPAITEKQVRQAIDTGKQFILQEQNPDGSWDCELANYKVGATALTVLALLNCEMTIADEPIQRALEYLRNIRPTDDTYERSLMLMVFAAAKDGTRDRARMLTLTNLLIEAQAKVGTNAGGWGYNNNGPGRPDRSNSQFAVLGLREAQFAGIPVDRQVWERAHRYWSTQQSGDGGWNYVGAGNADSTGSMTVAGVSTMVILETMLRNNKDENPDGTPNCCEIPPPNNSLERGLHWLERHFSVGHNPGGNIGGTLYYLYGLERAGRLSGQRFIGSHDWYREGAQFLLRSQIPRDRSWMGNGHGERDPVVGTSLALLFLSKGLAPVLINKLEYRTNPGPIQPGDQPWNRHPHDIRNLTDLISGLPGWPKLVTWQQLDLSVVAERGGLEDLMLSPILFMNGDQAPKLNAKEVDLLRQYVMGGGFIFAEATCSKTEFDKGFRQLIKQMYPDGDMQLKRLGADHPVFRSEHLLDPDTTELWGVEVGCRTSIMYSPNDFSCLWDKWSIADPPRRTAQMKLMISKATKVGVNVVAYAVGREPPSSLAQAELTAQNTQNENIERGLLTIGILRHTGGWDAAPHALKNLLIALNSYSGATAVAKPRIVTAVDKAQLTDQWILFMHGRNQFQMSPTERDNIREHLKNGGLLFADSCCGSPQFDKSFRTMIEQMYPEARMKRIPVTHELYSTSVGHDLHAVKRREPASTDPGQPLKINTVVGEPVLEGVEIDGRYVVIYSPFDISCALERQSSAACIGYLQEDAVKIAVNVVLYSLLQQ